MGLGECVGLERGALLAATSVPTHPHNPALPPAQVKVKKRGDDRKFLARVLAVGTECDIALLTGEQRSAPWLDEKHLRP